MENSMYIVEVVDDNEIYDYEYLCYNHAKEHYDNEKRALLIEYNNGKHYLAECK